MAAFENKRFRTFKDSWPWPWIRWYCIPSCITHRPLPTYQLPLKSKLFVDEWTYGTKKQTFETHLLGRLRRVDLKTILNNKIRLVFHRDRLLKQFMRYGVHNIWHRQPAVTMTFNIQNLIRASVRASEYFLSVLSKLFNRSWDIVATKSGRKNRQTDGCTNGIV